MHDPLVVAFEIRRPWPRRQLHSMTDARWSIGRSAFWTLAGRCYYFPSMVTVWHREPGGRDAGEVCKHHSRYQDPNGDWQWKFHHGWRFHVHHWKIQVSPLQELRRRLLTRCAWCVGRHRKGDPVNISHQWGGLRSRWWRGERSLYHHDCSMIENAHRTCVCETPVKGLTWGVCAACDKHIPHNRTPEHMAVVRRLAVVPEGQRDTEAARG